MSWRLRGAVRDGQSVTPEWTPVAGPRIAGVRLHEVRPVIRENGTLVEVYRADWHLDALGVAQVFLRTLEPGAVSAWHAHEHTTDRLFVTRGRMRIVLFDPREGSPTRGALDVILSGEERPQLLVIPPQVWHGVQNLAHVPSTLLNAVDVPYTYAAPDHWRLPPDTPEIPYRFPPLGR